MKLNKSFCERNTLSQGSKKQIKMTKRYFSGNERWALFRQTLSSQIPKVSNKYGQTPQFSVYQLILLHTTPVINNRSLYDNLL